MADARGIAGKLTKAGCHGLLCLGAGADVRAFTAHDADMNTATAEALYRRGVFLRVRPTNGPAHYRLTALGREVRAILQEQH